MQSCDVAIIGAGPYGLCAAAHLRTIKGIEVKIFGQPMSFWASMPGGMLLRSNWTATQMPDPQEQFTLEAFQAAAGCSFGLPVPLQRFIEYGRWYQKQAVPDVDARSVERVEKSDSQFRITVEGGEIIRARRVVVAAGIGSFAWCPPRFAALPRELVSHTSEHRDLSAFAERRVLVVGGGQSALESAALMHEAGTAVEVAARASCIHWLQGFLSRTLHHRLGPFVRRLLYAPTDVGPAVLSQLLARPHWLNVFPGSIRSRLRKRATRPAGARWLVNRLQGVPIRLSTNVVWAKPVGTQLQVRFQDGHERHIDHLLLATGYRVDISKYEFLEQNLLRSISCVNGFPLLRAGLETSVDGLHMLGAPAAWSFGPIMQFVSGTNFASNTLLAHIAKQRTSCPVPVLQPIANHVSDSV
jgi:FAD-dependent urate hydroxylase